jgi:hypothetical protein
MQIVFEARNEPSWLHIVNSKQTVTLAVIKVKPV